jgi:hypothetical protein
LGGDSRAKTARSGGGRSNSLYIQSSYFGVELSVLTQFRNIRPSNDSYITNEGPEKELILGKKAWTIELRRFSIVIST